MSTPEVPKHVPPVPRYGEYAPVAPAQPENSGPPAPQAPVYQPMGQHYQPPAYGNQGYYPPNGARPLRTGDMIASVILLVIGGFAVLYAVLNAFTMNMQMEALYAQYGIDAAYEPGPASAVASAVIIISHLVLYALAVIFTITLIRKRRMSFWLPLSIGAVASIIFIATILVLAFSDPLLFEAAMQQSGQ